LTSTTLKRSDSAGVLVVNTTLAYECNSKAQWNRYNSVAILTLVYHCVSIFLTEILRMISFEI